MKRVDRSKLAHAAVHASCKHRMQLKRRRARGFTLIELMIAITLLAVVAVLSWRGLDQIVRGRQVVTAVMSNERVIAQAFDQIGSDVRAAAQDDDAGGSAIAVGNGFLEIVRYLDMPNQAPRYQLIQYVVQDRQLFRLASPPLATLGALQAARGQQQGQLGAGWSRVALIHGIDALQSSAWVDASGWTADQAALRTASARARDALTNPLLNGVPLFRVVTGVRVSVAFGDTGSRPQSFERLYLVGQ